MKPYYWNLGAGRQIAEMPVTTVPVLKFPFHLSYLIYLSNVSMYLMRIYLGFALFLCKLTRTPVSFLLHPLDLIGGDQIAELSFFPGMQTNSHRKVEVFKTVIQRLSKSYQLTNMTDHLHYEVENVVFKKLEP